MAFYVWRHAKKSWQSRHCELILFGADSELSPHSDHLNLFSWGKVPRVIYESFSMNNCWPIIDPKRGYESLPASTQSSSNREIFDLNESVLLNTSVLGSQKIDGRSPKPKISAIHWMNHPTTLNGSWPDDRTRFWIPLWEMSSLFPTLSLADS